MEYGIRSQLCARLADKWCVGLCLCLGLGVVGWVCVCVLFSCTRGWRTCRCCARGARVRVSWPGECVCVCIRAMYVCVHACMHACSSTTHDFLSLSLSLATYIATLTDIFHVQFRMRHVLFRRMIVRFNRQLTFEKFLQKSEMCWCHVAYITDHVAYITDITDVTGK